MPSIGETLREARLRQRLDIADVEASTKIRAKYLRALENEEFAMLPGSTFVKTFLRTYAEQLGLDPHRLVEEYRANYEGPDEAELQPLTPPAVSRRQREPRRSRTPGGGPSRLPIVIGAVLAVLVLLVILGWEGDSDDAGTPADTQAAQTQTTTEAKKKQPAKPKRKAKPKPAAPTTVSLKITPIGETYVCLDTGAGTETLFEGTLTAARTFKGKHLRLNLGRTSVQINLNGKRFNVPQSSSPVGYDFTPKGGKLLESGLRPCA